MCLLYCKIQEANIWEQWADSILKIQEVNWSCHGAWRQSRATRFIWKLCKVIILETIPRHWVVLIFTTLREYQGKAWCELLLGKGVSTLTWQLTRDWLWSKSSHEYFYSIIICLKTVLRRMRLSERTCLDLWASPHQHRQIQRLKLLVQLICPWIGTIWLQTKKSQNVGKDLYPI